MYIQQLAVHRTSPYHFNIIFTSYSSAIRNHIHHRRIVHAILCIIYDKTRYYRILLCIVIQKFTLRSWRTPPSDTAPSVPICNIRILLSLWRFITAKSYCSVLLTSYSLLARCRAKSMLLLL